MLIQSRVRHDRKKLYNLTLNESIMTKNPQIKKLTDKLQRVTQSIFQDVQIYNPLNLITWEREKYFPNQSQNRLRIENRISLVRVCNEKVRSRFKPIKGSNGFFNSDDKSTPKNYKQHYEQIKQIFKRENNKTDSLESQEQQQSSANVIIQRPATTENRVKYYQNLKKYSKVIQYVQNKINSKSQNKEKKSLSTFYSKSNSILLQDLGLESKQIKQFSQSVQINVQNNKKRGQEPSVFESTQMKTWMSKFYPSRKKQKTVFSSTRMSKTQSLNKQPIKCYLPIKSESYLNKKRYTGQPQQQKIQLHKFTTQ